MINFYTLNNPDLIINLCELSDYCQIKHIVEHEKNIKTYCYAFILKNVPQIGNKIINIGKDDCPNDCRVYRKGGHLSGWGIRNLGPNTSGIDMKKVVVDRTEKLYPTLTVHKDNIIIHIWNTTDIVSEQYGINPTIRLECKLFDEFNTLYGGIPIGNIQKPKRPKAGPTMDQFTLHFD